MNPKNKAGERAHRNGRVGSTDFIFLKRLKCGASATFSASSEATSTSPIGHVLEPGTSARSAAFPTGAIKILAG
jgi:hypothetical protein